MSHRGYGDPPYPPNDPNSRPRAASGRDRERRGGSDVDRDTGRFDPWDDDPRSPTYAPDDQGRAGGSRWSASEVDPYDPGSGRQSRSRWSNPPPRRRRGATGASRPPVEPIPAPRVDTRSTEPDLYRDPYTDPAYAPNWDESVRPDVRPDEVGDDTRARRQSRLAGRMGSTRGRLTSAASGRRAPRPSLPTLRMPVSLGRVDILQDHVAMLLVGVAALSALVMAGVLAGRIGNLPDVIELRYDAEGAPTRWGTPTSLWELPLLAGMVTIINLVLAWWLSSYDRFAGRFLLATASVVSLLTWIPLVRFLW